MNYDADFVKKAKLFIDKNNLISRGEKVLVCLSGGADSVCLLKVLCELKDELAFSIRCAHVNHMLRGDESDSDEKFCRDLCSSLQVEIDVLCCDVAKVAKNEKQSLEAAARNVRYDFFASLAKKYGIDKIATAHNKNDNAETGIMHYLRGSGLEGLKGIVPLRKDGIIRPILCMTRKEIEAYLKSIGQRYVTDSTNFSDEYARNKIRLNLLPQIEREYNPNIVDAIADNALLLALDAEYINKKADKAYKKIAREEDGKVYIDVGGYVKLDAALSLRIIRKAIAYVKGTDKDISYDTIMRCDELFYSDKTPSVSVSDVIFARRRYDSVCIEVESEGNVQYCYRVEEGKELYIAEADMYVLMTVENAGKKREKGCEYFDYNLCTGQIYIRNRKNGDRFAPYAMNGTKKLKDFFIDEKIEREKRDKIPLLVCEDEILCVCGIRRSNLYTVNQDTKKVLKINFLRGKRK